MSYVNPPTEPAVALDDLSGEITVIISETRDLTTRMETLFNNTIEDLTDIVGTYNPDIGYVVPDLEDIDKPIFPPAPILENFSSVVWDSLVTKVVTDIEEGGTGLSPVVYNAIIEREKEARRVNQDTEYQRALNAAGATGFDLPSGHVAAIISEFGKENISKDQDSLNNVIIKDFDTATENTRFAVTTGVELEKILRQAWETTEERKVELYKVQSEAASSEYESLVKWALAQIEVIKVEAELAIKNEELKLDAYNATVALATKVSETIASLSAQIIASALGAINTTVSNTYTGTESRRESWTHSEQLSESHSYEEG